MKPREKIVRAPDNRPPHQRRHPAFTRTPEQAAAAHADALYAQAVWRAECAAREEANEPQLLARITRRPPGDTATRRAQFASQVARAEFGRFYWQEPVSKKPAKPPKRRGNGATGGKQAD
jgi:hypothetical protein